MYTPTQQSGQPAWNAIVAIALGVTGLIIAEFLPVGMLTPMAEAAPTQSQEVSMKIRVDVDGEVVTATLDDVAAARDFAALLPLSLTLKDYADIERIADLPRKLSTTGAPAGMTPEAGDITYFATWGNLAIFVADGKGSSRGLVRLGSVDTGLPALQRPGPLKVRIERITN